MEVQPALALPGGLEVTGIDMIDEVLTITAVSTQRQPRCPLCGTSSTRIHSLYTRRIADLPCGGQQVCLLVLVRKCFCEMTTCARKIFAERITPFVAPWARVTARLFQIVQAIGLATGGMLGARLSFRLGIRTCFYDHPAPDHGASNGANWADTRAWHRRFLVQTWPKVRDDPGGHAEPQDH